MDLSAISKIKGIQPKEAPQKPLQKPEDISKDVSIFAGLGLKPQDLRGFLA